VAVVGASLRTLVRRRGRTLLALAGIAVSAALLLDMTMLGAGLTASFRELTVARGYGLRVAPEGTLPFDTEAGIRDAALTRRRIEGVPGVRAVAPVLGAQLWRVAGDSLHEPLFTTGLDATSQMIYDLLEGADPGAGQVVVSRPLAEQDGLRPGDTLLLAAGVEVVAARPRGVRSFVVSGVADFVYDAAGQRSLAAALEDVQAMTGRPDEVSLFAVAGEPGWDEAHLAAGIGTAAPGVSVYSTAELMERMNERLLYFRQLATILGSIATVVTALLVVTIVTIGVRERFGEIATMRAIGIPSLRILSGVVAEGLVLSAAGCAVGIPLGIWTARWLDGILRAFPGLPVGVSFFVLEPERAAFAVLVVIGVGAAGAAVPGIWAVRAPLGQSLREEAE
jgi:putative ABC transport system permease protein